jgi:hypothetical protein
MSKTDIQIAFSTQSWISPYMGSVSSAGLNSLKVLLPESPLLLNAMRLLKYVGLLNYEQNFPSFTLL